MIYKLCIALIIIGGLNWGLVGLLNFNLVDFLFGAAICSIPALFSSTDGEGTM